MSLRKALIRHRCSGWEGDIEDVDSYQLCIGEAADLAYPGETTETKTRKMRKILDSIGVDPDNDIHYKRLFNLFLDVSGKNGFRFGYLSNQAWPEMEGRDGINIHD